MIRNFQRNGRVRGKPIGRERVKYSKAKPFLVAQSLSICREKLMLSSEFSPGGSKPIFGEIDKPISLEKEGYLTRSGENNFESIIWN